MKNYIFFLVVMAINAEAQSIVDVKLTHNNCPEDKNGSIQMDIDDSVLDNYPLPYDCEWENLTNGDYEEFVINSSEHLVTNLASGNYEVIIHLNDECDIYLDEVIVDKYPKII